MSRKDIIEKMLFKTIRYLDYFEQLLIHESLDAATRKGVIKDIEYLREMEVRLDKELKKAGTDEL